MTCEAESKRFSFCVCGPIVLGTGNRVGLQGMKRSSRGEHLIVSKPGLSDSMNKMYILVHPALKVSHHFLCATFLSTLCMCFYTLIIPFKCLAKYFKICYKLHSTLSLHTLLQKGSEWHTACVFSAYILITVTSSNSTQYNRQRRLFLDCFFSPCSHSLPPS